MKLNIRTIVFAIIIACSTALNAQQVNTMYFLENAPMRHLINPAFQPASKVYITLPAIGYTSLGAGNNVFAINSLIFKDPTTGNTITALHPNADGKLWKKLPKNTVINTEAYVNLLGLGFRIKEAGYFHLNLAERLDVGIGIPNQVFGILHGQQITQLDLSRLNVSATAYTELAFGYSHRINE